LGKGRRHRLRCMAVKKWTERRWARGDDAQDLAARILQEAWRRRRHIFQRKRLAKALMTPMAPRPEPLEIPILDDLRRTPPQSSGAEKTLWPGWWAGETPEAKRQIMAILKIQAAHRGRHVRKSLRDMRHPDGLFLTQVDADAGSCSSRNRGVAAEEAVHRSDDGVTSRDLLLKLKQVLEDSCDSGALAQALAEIKDSGRLHADASPVITGCEVIDENRRVAMALAPLACALAYREAALEPQLADVLVTAPVAIARPAEATGIGKDEDRHLSFAAQSPVWKEPLKSSPLDHDSTGASTPCSEINDAISIWDDSDEDGAPSSVRKPSPPPVAEHFGVEKPHQKVSVAFAPPPKQRPTRGRRPRWPAAGQVTVQQKFQGELSRKLEQMSLPVPPDVPDKAAQQHRSLRPVRRQRKKAPRRAPQDAQSSLLPLLVPPGHFRPEALHPLNLDALHHAAMTGLQPVRASARKKAPPDGKLTGTTVLPKVPTGPLPEARLPARYNMRAALRSRPGGHFSPVHHMWG